MQVIELRVSTACAGLVRREGKGKGRGASRGEGLGWCDGAWAEEARGAGAGAGARAGGRGERGKEVGSRGRRAVDSSPTVRFILNN